MTDELKHLATRAWRKTRPEHRRDLTRRLSSTVPDLIRKTLQEWADGPSAPAGDAGGERADLEHDITRALVNSDGDRPAAIDDIEASLKGIPDEIAIKVLRDWRADLLDKNADPDPRTTDRSSLNDRILSQLSKAGVSLRSLDAATGTGSAVRTLARAIPTSCRFDLRHAICPAGAARRREPVGGTWLAFATDNLGMAAAVKKAVFPEFSGSN